MTASERKFVAREIVLILVAALVIVGWLFAYHFVITPSRQGLNLHGQFFNTEVVSSQEDTARGLSGRDQLDSHTAMVFEFGEAEQHCMWMKDMKFSIDIVWLDTSKKIVAIERNVAPNTYPQTFCHDGQTVVEFAAGTADSIPLYTGDQIQ